jgi:PTS system mannitol-specific IIB component
VKDVTVTHLAARTVPANAQLIVVHKGLAGVVHAKAPSAVIVTFNHFINDPAFDSLVQAIANKGTITSSME